MGATRIMLVCADRELCKLPNRPLGEKDGHECRLGFGGRLQGICGEPEKEGGQEINTPRLQPVHRQAAEDSWLLHTGKGYKHFQGGRKHF